MAWKQPDFRLNSFGHIEDNLVSSAATPYLISDTNSCFHTKRASHSFQLKHVSRVLSYISINIVILYHKYYNAILIVYLFNYKNFMHK